MAETDYVRLGCKAEACSGKHKAHGYCLRHYRQWQRGGVKHDATHCAHCGAQMPEKMVCAMYCSRRCKRAAWAAANPERMAAHRAKEQRLCAYFAKHCEGCGKPGGARRDWSLCADCRRERELEAGRQAARAMGEAKHKAEARETECEECKARFCPLYGASNAALCAPCAEHRKRQQRKAAKEFRKALERGANGGQSVQKRRVFERDGWLCRLCGIETPERLMGTIEHNAPELDHIVPVSRGGLHTYANTQCLCRSCNGWKGARTMQEAVAALAA